MSLSRSLLSMSLSAALLGATAGAWAQKPQQRPAPQNPAVSQPHAPRDQQALSEAVRRAERNGQVLSAEQVQYDGRDVNRVKIVDDQGRVRVYWDDPAAQRQGQDQPQQQQQRGQGRPAVKPRNGARTRSDDDGDPTL